ncbi:hypothetical protein B0H16DRAFT_1601105 [Mycena metata]|uniref:Uncharacterized protein n=1 Tax=Mycena metata TaxID=1033252 RepID=A0AAD7MKV0_9AGAR|nr:hypothetical protein B0H16DRAFT_1601105 [Mycena metata]
MCSYVQATPEHSVSPHPSHSSSPTGPPPMFLSLFSAHGFFQNPAAAYTLQSRGTQSCGDPSSCRTTFDIVWGCLTTIFACTWVSVHPNLPAPRQSWLRLAVRRLAMMLMAVIAPEIMVFFAARQFFFARRFSKVHNVSLTHGFFFAMGGFVSHNRQDPITTWEQLEAPLGAQYVADIQSIDTTTIMDRSKGDALSKGVALIQSLWFIIQCLARASQQLPIIELEFATLAFAVVNIFIWLLWWHKPLDVQCPIPIGPAEDFDDTASVPRKNIVLPQLLASMIGAIYGADNYDPASSDCVPLLWSTPASFFRSFLLEALVAMIFGAIHCTAWRTVFPSSIEMWLWRVSALIVTAIPSLMALVQVTRPPTPLERTALIEALFLGTLLLYIFCRVVLIVLPFLTLRDLPPGALMDINWTDDIPHV